MNQDLNKFSEGGSTIGPVTFKAALISKNRFPGSVVLRLGGKILIRRKNLEAFELQGGERLKREA